jgi:predicted metal-dependent TIM-barrel fold hydrolase
MDHLTYEQYIEVIRTVGAQGVILSSDVGQIFSPTVSEAMREFFDEFQKRGIKEDEIVQMSVMNTNHLLFDPIETFEKKPAKGLADVSA